MEVAATEQGALFCKRPNNIVFTDTPKHLDACTLAIIQTFTLVILSGPPMLLHHPPPRTQKLRMRHYPKSQMWACREPRRWIPKGQESLTIQRMQFHPMDRMSCSTEVLLQVLMAGRESFW